MGNKREKLKNGQKYKIQINCHRFFNDRVMQMKINWKKIKKAKLKNEMALRRQKQIELKKMAAVMHYLNFWELDKKEENMWGARAAKINEMKAEENLLLTGMIKKKKMVIWALHWFEIWFHL